MSDFSFEILTEDYGGDENVMLLQGLAAIEATIAINILHFQRYPQDICALACGKIKYDSVNKDVLDIVSKIKTAPIMIRDGIGLCIDIVAFDVAAKRLENMKSYPVILNRGKGFFHFVTGLLDRNGREIQYDPSAELERMGYVVTTQPSHCKCAI